MTFAPVLSEVAAELTGRSPSLVDDPTTWAYTLRDAVELARPDWIVSHHDLGLEASALTGPVSDVDAVGDVVLARTPAGLAVGEAVRTLAGLFPGVVVAASVTGPATVAAAACRAFELDPQGDEGIDLLDVSADVIAAYAAALAEHGADRVLVWETDPGAFDPADIASAHRPLVRRLGTIGTPAALCHDGRVEVDGYGAVADPQHGLVDPAVFATAATFADVLATPGAAGPLLVTAGPVPASCDPAVLRSAGERNGPQR